MPPDLTDRAVSRRAVVRTAAWAVPAVSVVAAAPAFAASTPGVLTYVASPTWLALEVGGAVGFLTVTSDGGPGVGNGFLTLPYAPTQPLQIVVRLTSTVPGPGLGDFEFFVTTSLSGGAPLPIVLDVQGAVATFTVTAPVGTFVAGTNPLNIVGGYVGDPGNPPAQLDVSVVLDDLAVGPVVFPAPSPYPDPEPVVGFPTSRRSAPGGASLTDLVGRLAATTGGAAS